MSRLGRRLGALAVAGLALGGCMNGRSALLATQGPQGGSAELTAVNPQGSPVGGAVPVGPARTSSRALTSTRTLASSGLLASSGSNTARVRLGVQASGPAVGALKVSSGLKAGVTPVAASGRLGVAITPTLAPAAAVGASVAAVSQPLNVAVAARVRTRAGLKTIVKPLVGKTQTGLGLSLHAGG